MLWLFCILDITNKAFHVLTLNSRKPSMKLKIEVVFLLVFIAVELAEVKWGQDTKQQQLYPGNWNWLMIMVFSQQATFCGSWVMSWELPHSWVMRRTQEAGASPCLLGWFPGIWITLLLACCYVCPGYTKCHCGRDELGEGTWRDDGFGYVEAKHLRSGASLKGNWAQPYISHTRVANVPQKLFRDSAWLAELNGAHSQFKKPWATAWYGPEDCAAPS